MTWTYDSTDLSTDLAQVRLRIGDTNTDDQLLTDEEINHYLGLKADVDLAAADCIEFGIIPKLSRDVDRSNLGMSATRSQKVQHYMDLVDRLRRGSWTGAEITSTGQSKAAQDANEADTDLIQPLFERNHNRNAGW